MMISFLLLFSFLFFHFFVSLSLFPLFPDISTPRREEAYNKSRRSLKMWPVKGEDLEDSVKMFMANKLKINDDRIRSMGPVSVKSAYGRAAVGRAEVVVVFDCREDRDFVKAAGYNLAGEKEVGMSIHVPGHLLDNYHALSSIGYNIKTKNEGVKRSIKFDDSIQNIYLDICIGGIWRRILPREARSALSRLPHGNNGDKSISAQELLGLVRGAEEEGDDGHALVEVPEDGNDETSKEE